MTEADMWHSAISMRRMHGDKAAMEAARVADKLLARDDKAGHAAWKRITRAIRALERDGDNAG